MTDQPDEDPVTPFGQMFRLYVQITEIPLRELSKITGISTATLSRMQRGHGFDTDTLLKFLRWALKKIK